MSINRPDEQNQGEIISELERTHNKESKPRDISGLAIQIQDILQQLYRYQAEGFIHHVLKRKMDFKINEYLSFQIGRIIISNGEKKRVFTLVKKRDLATNILNLTANGYHPKDIVRLLFQGIKQISIPESTLASVQGLFGLKRDADALHWVETIGESTRVNKTDHSMEYVPIEDAIGALLTEINMGNLETKDPLINPYSGISSQVDQRAFELMEQIGIPMEERGELYTRAVKEEKPKPKKKS